MDVEDGALD